MILTKEQFELWKKKCGSSVHPQLFFQGFGGVARVTTGQSPKFEILEVRPVGCLDHKHSQFFKIAV